MKFLGKSLVMIFTLWSSFTFAQNGLKIGDMAPDFKALDNSGKTIELKSLLKKGHSVVLVFYRGQWCPYCNKYMQKLQDSLALITNKNAYIVAISPETTENIAKTVEKTHASFSIIHDEKYSIMKAYDVQYTMNSDLVAKYKNYGIDLVANNGNPDNVLPVPATYIISPNGKIKFVHFNKDYKVRMSVAAILSYL